MFHLMPSLMGLVDRFLISMINLVGVGGKGLRAGMIVGLLEIIPVIPVESKKCPAFERPLLPEYISNDIYFAIFD